MKYLLVKRNLNSSSFTDLSTESIAKEYKNSILNHVKKSEDWTQCDAIAFSASQYYGQVLDCFEVDDKDHLFLVTKYSDITYKTIDKELEDELYEKMKALGYMAKKLRELDSALSFLQSIESDLYNSFTDALDSEPHVYEFTDLSIDEHQDEYSVRNNRIKEVFDDFFS
jgi:hypothetical protein